MVDCVHPVTYRFASQISSLFSALCHSLQHQGVIYLLFETRCLLFPFYPFWFPGSIAFRHGVTLCG